MTSLVEGLTDEEVLLVGAVGLKRVFERGAIIIEEATRGDELYVLCAGRVEVEMIKPGSDETRTIHLTSLEAGTVLGEIALVDHTFRSARVTALTTAETLLLPCPALNAVLEKYPRIGYVVMRNLARVMCHRLRETNFRLQVELVWSRAEAKSEKRLRVESGE